MALPDRHLLRASLALLASLALVAGCLDDEPEPPPEPTEEQDAGLPPDPGDAGLPIDADAGISGPAVTFKLMTWNVHDLFDESDDPAKEDETGLSTGQVDAKLSDLARVIKAAAPDVLALQEVETKELLGRLNGKLGASALPHYELVPTYDKRGINVAIMSRFPITRVVSHVTDRIYPPDSPRYYLFPRDCLEVRLDVGGNRQLAVLVNHHTSALSDASGEDREAQSFGARQIADRLRAENPFLAVVLAGDMNSDEGTRAINLLTEGGGFVDIGMQVSLSSRWTYVYRGEEQRLDYIIPDSRTASWVSNVYFIHTAASDDASDHEPMTATFTYP